MFFGFIILHFIQGLPTSEPQWIGGNICYRTFQNLNVYVDITDENSAEFWYYGLESGSGSGYDYYDPIYDNYGINAGSSYDYYGNSTGSAYDYSG